MIRDALFITGLGLAGFGIYRWEPALCFMFAGATLIAGALLLEWRHRRRVEELKRRGDIKEKR